MKRRKVLLSWSSGKDSAWSLHTLRRDPSLEVVGLLPSTRSSTASPCTPSAPSCSGSKRRRRAYRERQMAGSGLDLLFPLWESATAALAREMVAAGLRAWVTSVDPRRLDASFCGREWDASFLEDLPAGVDPCGENGEFHTFVYAGPMLDRTLAVTRGEVVERDGYVFTDLLPA